MSRTIFISYSKEHPEPTKELAAYLEDRGFDVWWDTNLKSGEIYRDVIDARLNECAIVLVIWTPASIKSRWVIAEADHADRLGKLIPIRTRDVEPHNIPKPYGTLHNDLLEDRQAILNSIESALERRASKDGTAAETTARFELVVGLRESKKAFREFCSAVEIFGQRLPARLGHQGANFETRVHYSKSGDVWCAPFANNDEERFWIAFGQGEPAPPPKSTNIIVEMNPPHEGENRNVGGVFLKDDAGRYYIGHTGKIGGGKTGVSKSTFTEYLGPDGWVSFARCSGNDRALVFGPFSSPKLMEQLGAFVNTVKEFKKQFA